MHQDVGQKWTNDPRLLLDCLQSHPLQLRSLRSKLKAVLFGVTVVAFVLLVREGRALGELSRSLKTAAAPNRMQSLQLPPTRSAAEAILSEWNEKGLIQTAKNALERDTRFIVAYVGLGIALALFATAFAEAAAWVAVPIVLFAILAGISDGLENHFLWRQLNQPLDPVTGDIVRARAWAMTKFLCLLLAALPTAALILGGANRWLARRTAHHGASNPAAPARSGCSDRKFPELIKAENNDIFSDENASRRDDPRFAENINTDEPKVSFRSADVTGLALSGGGIRSSTFNLGLLQGLNERNLLPLIDYMATVSGGGYVGALWSAWLTARQADRKENRRPFFPQAARRRVPGSVESDAERHVREFSKFLSPRWGFFEVETWRALVAVIAGLIPALVIALCVVGVAVVAWLALSFPLAFQTPRATVYMTVTITLLTLGFFEWAWQTHRSQSSGKAQSSEKGGRGWRTYLIISAVALGLVGVGQWYVSALYRAGDIADVWLYLPGGPWTSADFPAEFRLWWVLVGLEPSIRQVYWTIALHVFDYGLVWLAAALTLIALRLLFAVSAWPPPAEWLSAFDRVLMRILGLAVAWLALAVVWHVVINTIQATKWIAAAAIAAGGAFAALRNWIAVAFRPPKDAGLLTQLKAYLPRTLAYLTIILATAVVGSLLVAAGATDWTRWYTATAAMLGVLSVGLFINPAAFGMHAFYRDRLTRAFTGAGNKAPGMPAAANRATEPLQGDDVDLDSLGKRPLHLVCCAANDLSGDTIETLGRGARSAVLSKEGFSVGSYWSPTDLTLGSAITASAAAFNSSMGSLSVELGPAVSFLMTALNLRLGIWVRHPAAAAPDPRRWPGVLFFREMFSMTSASGEIQCIADRYEVPKPMRDVHLSDGGHFENLALYELVRRHCRYILLSDCGEDHAVAFDDLGNALRRIREDFGVDISIDVAPLRPGPDGMAKQHVAIGAIHYSETDRGILLYVKPSLTGNEPPDILQYKSRNSAFPHESTGDQFYDEAQYESYRRLGLHAAGEVFAFVPPAAEPASGHRDDQSVDTSDGRSDVTSDWVFVEATHRWGPTPPGLEDRVLEMTGRLAELERQLHEAVNHPILREAFPELDFATTAIAGGKAAKVDSNVVISNDVLAIVIRMTQIMEDVWIACELDDWWDHPLNLGWVNLFARWATAPSYRFWWPIVSAMYSPGFRRFIEARFPVPGPPDDVSKARSERRVPQRGHIEPLKEGDPDGLAAMWWKTRSTQPRNWAGRRLYQNLVDLSVNEETRVPVQVAIAAVTESGPNVGWTSDDFFVPPSLWGARFGWSFLDNLLNDLYEHRGSDDSTAYVVVKRVPPEADHQIALDDRVAFINQYRKIGFRQQPPGHAGVARRDAEILNKLGYQPADTLFTLNLKAWGDRRGHSR